MELLNKGNDIFIKKIFLIFMMLLKFSVFKLDYKLGKIQKMK
jgi:hypothetical protein